MTSFYCLKACKWERVSENQQIWAYVIYGCSFLKFYIWACRYALHWNLIFVIFLIQYFTQNLICLYKFYPVRSFHYSWNNHLVMFLYKWKFLIYTWKLDFVLLLSHFQSCFLCADEYTWTQLSFSTKYQRWDNIGWSTLNRRNSFNFVSTLFCQRWNNVDKCTLAQLSFLIKHQHWSNVDAC